VNVSPLRAKALPARTSIGRPPRERISPASRSATPSRSAKSSQVPPVADAGAAASAGCHSTSYSHSSILRSLARCSACRLARFIVTPAASQISRPSSSNHCRSARSASGLDGSRNRRAWLHSRSGAGRW
jgi:hypothetical protein